jgi:hypothetical protein
VVSLEPPLVLLVHVEMNAAVALTDPAMTLTDPEMTLTDPAMT